MTFLIQVPRSTCSCLYFCTAASMVNPFKFRVLENLVLVSKLSSSSANSLFTNPVQAELYAKYRPRYSPEVFEKMVEFCRLKPSGFNLAVDIGCGSGQSVIPLTNHFKKVIAVDITDEQIVTVLKEVINLTFQMSLGEDLSFLLDSSVDLLTVAHSFPGLDKDKFLKEANRVLKPNGSLVVYGHGLCHLPHPEADNYLDNLYRKVLLPYWTDGVETVLDKYKSVSLPYPGWKRDDSLSLKSEFTIDDLIGYFGSSSTIQTMLEKNPESTVLGDMKIKFLSWFATGGVENEAVKVKVEWPVFMLMGRKP